MCKDDEECVALCVGENIVFSAKFFFITPLGYEHQADFLFGYVI